jgi:hypothetical protein
MTSRTLKQIADAWRVAHPANGGGVVLIWNGLAYGWKNFLRDPQDERPGAIAVGLDGTCYKATGGDDYNGAVSWRTMSPDFDGGFTLWDDHRPGRLRREQGATYTVLSPIHEFMGSGLTAEQAARLILGYDDRMYEIRFNGDEYRLYQSERSRNSGGGHGRMVPSLYCRSIEKTEAAAHDQIFGKVVECSVEWDRSPYALRDEVYAELNEQEGE